MPYTVVFAPKLKDVESLESLLDELAKVDKTFSYYKRSNFFIFDDTDNKRIFRRAMWVKERLTGEIWMRLQEEEPEATYVEVPTFTMAKYHEGKNGAKTERSRIKQERTERRRLK
jgi:hypothetical protein